MFCREHDVFHPCPASQANPSARIEVSRIELLVEVVVDIDWRLALVGTLGIGVGTRPTNLFAGQGHRSIVDEHTEACLSPPGDAGLRRWCTFRRGDERSPQACLDQANGEDGSLHTIVMLMFILSMCCQVAFGIVGIDIAHDLTKIDIPRSHESSRGLLSQRCLAGVELIQDNATWNTVGNFVG